MLQRAAEKINEARKRKAARLKQAKKEAQAEVREREFPSTHVQTMYLCQVEKYRDERERAFKEYEAKHLGTKEDIEKQIRNETNAQLEEMKRSVQANKQQVYGRGGYGKWVESSVELFRAR